MRFYVIIFSLLCAVQYSSAQLNDIYLTRYNEVYTLDEEIDKEDKILYFLDGQWMPGMISVIGGKENLMQEIRYNLELDQLEVKVNDKVYTVDHSYVDRFHIDTGMNKYNFIRLDLSNFDLNKTNFLQILSDGSDFDLYKFYEVKESKANFNPVLQTGNKTARKKIEVAYGFSDGRSFKELPNSGRKRKKVLKKKPEFKKSIKDSELDLSNENDLIQLFTIVNNKLNTNENNK